MGNMKRQGTTRARYMRAAEQYPAAEAPAHLLVSLPQRISCLPATPA
jgi:hypothetical protein